jgi:hypothetical protein
MENKTGKYLKYAIGEIVLVVIGILIALQINNWNQSNKEKEIEQKYLMNILSDLKNQKDLINTQLEIEQSYYEAAGQIIKNYQQNNGLIIDSIFFKHATFITSRKTFVITNPTYTDLISSGNINIINNIEIKDKLIKYYQELERVEKITQNNNSLLVDQNYLSVFNKTAYYFKTDILELYGSTSKLNEHMTIPTYEIKLEDLSKNLLSKEENILSFMNAIYLRNTIAIGQYIHFKDVMTTTQSLINELEALNSR